MSRKIDLLRAASVGQGIFCLQECDEKFYSELIRTRVFDWSVSSLQLRDRGKFDGRNRHLGCVVAGFLPFYPARFSLLAETPLPERNLVVELAHDDARFAVASFHSLTGVSYKQAKVINFQMTADWLDRRRLPTVMCIDANTPRVDRPELAESEWWWKEEPILFGAERQHDLQDAFRQDLAKNPEELKAIVAERPDGPLAISHLRGSQNVPSRYDFVYVSPEWTVVNAQYRFEEAVDHGGDHALVSADLTLG